jgi:hypothetical protein
VEATYALPRYIGNVLDRVDGTDSHSNSHVMNLKFSLRTVKDILEEVMGLMNKFRISVKNDISLEMSKELLKAILNNDEIVHLKTKFYLLNLFMTEDNIDSLPSELINGMYKIIKVNKSLEGTKFIKYLEGFEFLYKVIDKLTADSMLLNIFSLINSPIVRLLDYGNSFKFDTNMTISGSKKHLKDCIPEYIAIFSTAKHYKGQTVDGLSDRHKMLLLNDDRYKLSIAESDSLRVFMITLHELAHLKRMLFSSPKIHTKSPIIITKFKALNHAKKMDIGTFLEIAVLGNLYQTILNESDEYTKKEEFDKLLNPEIWCGNMLEIADIVSVMRKKRNSSKKKVKPFTHTNSKSSRKVKTKVNVY